MKIDNAIILAAGVSNRFAPLSYECPKALLQVKGEVLVERQIRQLREAGISEIIIVIGYMADKFQYLREKYGVILVYNPDYLTRNNNGSIYAASEYFHNSYISAADLYFTVNPFSDYADESYYCVGYASGETKEWCVFEDKNGYIYQICKGGKDAWYMLSFAFWEKAFSKKFLSILDRIYNEEETRQYLWEDILMKNLNVLKMKLYKYPHNTIFEFDSLDELRLFDNSYLDDSRSWILKDIAKQLDVREKEILNIQPIIKSDTVTAEGFTFNVKDQNYQYFYVDKDIKLI